VSIFFRLHTPQYIYSLACGYPGLEKVKSLFSGLGKKDMGSGNSEQMAQECRDRGRELYHAGDYKEALKQYERAQKLHPSEPSYYTNRALCEQKIHGKWAAAREACQQCLVIDSKNVKGHYFLAKAYLEAEDYPKAILHFNLALEYAAERAQTKEFRDELQDALYVAKKRKYLAEEAQRIQELKELKEQCKRLLAEDAQRHQSGSQGNQGSPRPRDSALDTKLSLLETLFLQETQKVQSREVPESFCCKISMDVMKDPVVTPAGHSYDRRFLVQHLTKVGMFEPTTREPMTLASVVPNYNLRGAINEFLNANPWAYPG
jgi:STIP1 family protein 1